MSVLCCSSASKKVVFCLTCAVGVPQGTKYDASTMPSDLIKGQTDWLTDQTSWSWVYNLPAFCAARCFLAQFTACPVVCTALRFHWLSNDRRFFTKKSVEVLHIITATLQVWTDRPTDRPTDRLHFCFISVNIPPPNSRQVTMWSKILCKKSFYIV